MRTIAFASGKGGVGRTALTANIGVALASAGHRVVLIDTHLGLANLDILLDVTPSQTIQHVLRQETSLQDALTPGPAGVRLIGGGSGLEAIQSVTGPIAEDFLTQVHGLAASVDVVIFDTGGSLDDNTVLFLQASDEIFLIVTPDPASLVDAYATAKAVIPKRPDANIGVLVNMAESPAQAQAIFGRLEQLSSRQMPRPFHYLGHVRQDPQMTASTRSSKLLVLEHPRSSAARDLVLIAHRVVENSEPAMAKTH